MSYFELITRRQVPLEKTVMLGKTEGSRERRRSPSWLDSIREATGMCLQEQSRAAGAGHCGHHSFIGSPGGRAHSTQDMPHTQDIKNP